MLPKGTDSGGVVGHADIRLREYQTEPDVSLTDEEVALVRREFAGRLDVRPMVAAGNYVLEAQQYVGFIVLPTGRIIEISPKVRIGVLFGMLAKAHRLAEFPSEPVAHATVADLFEFIVQLFVSQVEDLVTQGILRSFEERRGHVRIPRGKILLADTIRYYPAVRDHHCCQFTEFTADIFENQVLKLTCHTLAPFRYRRIPGLVSRLRRLLRTFSDVALNPGVANSFDQLAYHRLNEYYRPALSLARLLLAHLSPSGALGERRFLAFLVDMNRLFQEYLTAILQESVAETNVTIVGEDQSHRLDVKGQLSVRPDIVFYRGPSPRLAIDAKYKSEEHVQDVYQGVAYCHALDIPRTLLVYPGSEEIALVHHRIRPPGNVEVRVQKVDLSGGLEELRQEAAKFCDSIWRQTNAIGAQSVENHRE